MTNTAKALAVKRAPVCLRLLTTSGYSGIAVTSQTNAERIYREFSCWAARRASRIARSSSVANAILVVERYLRGEVAFEEVRSARERASEGDQGAGTIGMPRAMPSAMAQIAAWHTTNESAEQAARLVIHHAARAAGFAALQRAVDKVLTADESASSWRNLYVWHREPQIEVAATAIEKAILEGELRRWLNVLGRGKQHSST